MSGSASVGYSQSDRSNEQTNERRDSATSNVDNTGEALSTADSTKTGAAFDETKITAEGGSQGCFDKLILAYDFTICKPKKALRLNEIAKKTIC